MGYKNYDIGGFVCPYCKAIGGLIEIGVCTELRRVYELGHEWRGEAKEGEPLDEESFYLESEVEDYLGYKLEGFRCKYCDGDLGSDSDVIKLLLEQGLGPTVEKKEKSMINKVVIA